MVHLIQAVYPAVAAPIRVDPTNPSLVRRLHLAQGKTVEHRPLMEPVVALALVSRHRTAMDLVTAKAQVRQREQTGP